MGDERDKQQQHSRYKVEWICLVTAPLVLETGKVLKF